MDSKLILAGINPHCGENGLLGSEDKNLVEAIDIIKSKFSIDITGPVAADSVLLSDYKPSNIFIFPFHDQGLGVFKSIHKFSGINITLGLKFLRLSPDHGTAFGIYGMDKANYLGQFFINNFIKRLGQNE